MATPPLQPPGWDLLSSVENDKHSYCPTPFTTSGLETQDLSAPTPVQYVDSQDREQWARSVSVISQSLTIQTLAFVQLKNWSREAIPDKSNPNCIYYDIEWIVVVEKTTPTRNTKTTISKNTDHDIVLEPRSYGTTVLVPELDEVLQRKFPLPRSGEIKDTEITVSAIGRLEVEFVREYPKTNIDWSEVWKQLLKRSDSFKKKKRLRVKVKFRYADVADQRANSFKKRGREAKGTATQNQLAICFAEQAVTGKPPDWQVAYAKRRCPGRPACLGDHEYCLVHPKTRKRHVLRTHHMRILVNHEAIDKSSEDYREIPPELIKLLDEEEDKRRKKEQDHKIMTTGTTAIQITNVVPGHSTPELQHVKKVQRKPIDIFGYADDNIQEYCDWHSLSYKKASLKAGVQRAAEFLIEGGFKLELLHDDPIADYLSEQGKVPLGIAKAIMNPSCIDAWFDEQDVKRRMLTPTQDLTVS